MFSSVTLTYHSINLSTAEESPANPAKRAKRIADVISGTRGFVIEGRVKWKSEIRRYKKVTDDDRLFSFTMYDTSSDISVLAVNELCDKWYPVIEVGQCYRIERLTARLANEQYNRTAHVCELLITKVCLST